MATLKTCFKCGVEKTTDDFYRHPQMADGYIGKCKECTRSDVRQHRQVNADMVRAYDRARANWPERKATRAAMGAKWRLVHMERKQAHGKVARAVKSGAIEKWPCWVCGSEQSEAHHPDYSAPLDVVWLCTAHHRQAHAIVTMATEAWKSWNLRRGVKESYGRKRDA